MEVSKKTLYILVVIAVILSVISTWLTLVSGPVVVDVTEKSDTANVKVNVMPPQPPLVDKEAGNIRLYILPKGGWK